MLRHALLLTALIGSSAQAAIPSHLIDVSSYALNIAAKYSIKMTDVDPKETVFQVTKIDCGKFGDDWGHFRVELRLGNRRQGPIECTVHAVFGRDPATGKYRYDKEDLASTNCRAVPPSERCTQGPRGNCKTAPN